ncbi:MAG: hypothetical protein H6817_09890 [Phycisphaerales bacterium]|nr:hypothetical protein [Phycisphaerales bacterium]
MNPPSLSATLPVDISRVDIDATLRRRLRAEPTALNPILMFTEIDAEFEYLLWDRPIVLDASLNWQLNPAVTERYTLAPDRMSAVLVLKDGLRWHDGAPFTAEDVAFSWARIMDDRVICRKARTGPDQLASCTADDARTVRFTFRRDLPTNRWNVDFPILPKHLYEPVMRDDPTLSASEAAVALNRAPVGNGPYRFVEWVDGQRIVLERWDDYPGETPAFRRIVFQVTPDNHAALLALETDQIDETPLTPQQFARETDGERFAAHAVKGKSSGWTTYYIGWNVREGHVYTSEEPVRQAMGFALNVPLIIERVFFGLFEPATGLFHDESSVGPTGVATTPFDLKLAAEQLDRAGWLRDPEDGWRYKEVATADGSTKRVRAGFTLNLVQGSQTSPKIADIYQQDLRKIGVELRTQVLEWSVFNERNYRGDFDAYVGAWTQGPEPDDVWNLLHSSAIADGRNYPGYANADVDETLEAGRATFDETMRRACYVRIANRVREDAPYTFVASAPNLWAFERGLHGVTFSPRGPALFFPGVRSWWRARE